jgi:hypothetical protein
MANSKEPIGRIVDEFIASDTGGLATRLGKAVAESAEQSPAGDLRSPYTRIAGGALLLVVFGVALGVVVSIAHIGTPQTAAPPGGANTPSFSTPTTPSPCGAAVVSCQTSAPAATHCLVGEAGCIVSSPSGAATRSPTRSTTTSGRPTPTGTAATPTLTQPRLRPRRLPRRRVPVSRCSPASARHREAAASSSRLRGAASLERGMSPSPTR